MKSIFIQQILENLRHQTQKTNDKGKEHEKYWEMTVTTLAELVEIVVGIWMIEALGRRKTLSFVSKKSILFFW